MHNMPYLCVGFYWAMLLQCVQSASMHYYQSSMTMEIMWRYLNALFMYLSKHTQILLSLGATRFEASYGILRQAVNLSITPTIQVVECDSIFSVSHKFIIGSCSAGNCVHPWYDDWPDPWGYPP